MAIASLPAVIAVAMVAACGAENDTASSLAPDAEARVHDAHAPGDDADDDVDASSTETDATVPGIPSDAGAFVPPILREVSSSCVLPSGMPLARGQVIDRDDCVTCQCSSWGLRCRKRASCTRDVCVFVDGTTIPSGGVAAIEPCFDCACTGGTPTCKRRVGGACPADACAAPGGITVPIGAEKGFSECHYCACDATAGLSCRDRCAPNCSCTSTAGRCASLCGAGGCADPDGGLSVPDQGVIPAGSCATVLCDYGSFWRDETRCP